MKNLPDKIYLNLNMTPQEIVETKDQDFHEATKTWEVTWSEERQSEHDPEYVRTDVFIEKACLWLSNVSIEDMTYKYNDFDTSEGWYKLIENFKNYMKGK